MLCYVAFKWSMLLPLFVDNTRLAMPKTSLDFVFFYDVKQNLKKRPFVLFIHLSEPLRKQKVVVRDLWLVDFDPFCVFLCFKVRCFVFEKHRKFYLSSKIFFIFFTLKHGKFGFQRWNCSYRASLEIQRKHSYGRVKRNRYVPANIYICWQTQWILR